MSGFYQMKDAQGNPIIKMDSAGGPTTYQYAEGHPKFGQSWNQADTPVAPKQQPGAFGPPGGMMQASPMQMQQQMQQQPMQMQQQQAMQQMLPNTMQQQQRLSGYSPTGGPNFGGGRGRLQPTGQPIGAPPPSMGSAQSPMSRARGAVGVPTGPPRQGFMQPIGGPMGGPNFGGQAAHDQKMHQQYLELSARNQGTPLGPMDSQDRPPPPPPGGGKDGLSPGMLQPFGSTGGPMGGPEGDEGGGPAVGMAQGPGDVSGHRADIQARYGLTEEETTAAIESQGQSLAGRPPAQTGQPMALPGYATPVSAPPPPQPLGQPQPLVGGPQQIPPGPMSDPGDLRDVANIEVASPYENTRQIEMASPYTGPITDSRKMVDTVEEDYSMDNMGGPDQGTGGGLAEQEWRLKIEPVGMNMGGRIPGYQNGGIVGLAHGGMVPGYAHGGEVPGYFLGGLFKGIKSLGGKGLRKLGEHAPEIMGLIGDEIPGFNKLSDLGRIAASAFIKQGSNKLSGGDFNLQEMVGDAGRTYAMQSAKDRIRDSLGRDIGGPEGRRTVEEMMKEGSGEGWERSAASGDRYEPTFISDEKGSGSMWKDIFTDSDAAKTALEAALDISPLEMMALNFTEQERKRGEQGESTGNLGFDPMSTVGRRMPTSMSAVSGRPATPATDIASQLTYGNMPADYTGRAEGGMIPGYQYGGMYGEEEGGDEFGIAQYVPMTSAGSRGSVPQGQGVAEQLTYGNQPAPGEEGEGNANSAAESNAEAAAEAINARQRQEAADYAMRNKDYSDLSFEDEVKRQKKEKQTEAKKELIATNELDLDDRGEQVEEMGEVDEQELYTIDDKKAANMKKDAGLTPSGKIDLNTGKVTQNREYIDANTQNMGEHYGQGLSGSAGATRVMPGSTNPTYGTSNQFSGAGSGFYGENKWFDPNAKEVAAKGISGLNPHELPRTAADFKKTGDKAGADLLARLGKAEGGMIESIGPILESITPEDMQALMMASAQLDSPNSRDVVANIMRKYQLSGSDINQMLEILRAEMQSAQQPMQAGGLIDDIPGYGIGGALKKALKVASFGGVQLLPEKIRDPINKLALKAAPIAANYLPIPGAGPLLSAGVGALSKGIEGKIDADRARDAAAAVPQGTEVDPLTSPALQQRQRYMPDPAARQASAQQGVADQMTYGDLGMQAGGLINGGGGDAMSDDIYVNAQMEANGDTQKIAVSAGEYIVPGDVVSHLGSGNTDGGADVMDQFIEDVRVQRTGTPVQPDPIDLSDVLPDTYGDRYV